MADTALTHLKGHDWLAKGLVPAPPVLLSRQTVQIAILREVQDFSIFRTEETRELNTAWTRSSVSGTDDVERVAFLATKQKGAESRELEALLRTWNPGAPDCYLKAKLCLKCPRCVLFGATDVSKGEKGANIKHRIAYATAFSLLSASRLREVHTFNGVDSATNLTGQTLGERQSVRPGALFASIVTLKAATELEFILAVKTIMGCTRYGAESRIGGVVRNHVVGIAVGHEEIISPLEFTLELAGEGIDNTPGRVPVVLEKFKREAASPGQVSVATADQLKGLLASVQAVDGATVEKAAREAAIAFRSSQEKHKTKAKE